MLLFIILPILLLILLLILLPILLLILLFILLLILLLILLHFSWTPNTIDLNHSSVFQDIVDNREGAAIDNAIDHCFCSSVCNAKKAQKTSRQLS